jgi:hypothetical protein
VTTLTRVLTNLMSTSRYSKSDITSPSKTDDYPERWFNRVDKNRRRRTKLKYAIIATLLLVDILALIGSTDIVESLVLVLLVFVNLWALNYTRP